MSSKTHPNIGLIGEWPLGNTTWKSDNDRNIRALDMISQVRVITADLTVPPAMPADGDTYMVGGSNPPSGAAATGEWAGKDGYIARYDAGNSADGRSASWEFWKPKEGWLISIVSGTGVPSGLYQIYSGGAVWWLTDIKSGLNLFVGSDLHVGGAKRINSVGAGFFSALSISGLTNGKLPRVSTSGGLFADSAFGDDGSVASCSRRLSVPNGVISAGDSTSSTSFTLSSNTSSFVAAYYSGTTNVALPAASVADGKEVSFVTSGAQLLTFTSSGIGIIIFSGGTWTQVAAGTTSAAYGGGKKITITKSADHWHIVVQ